MRKSPTGMSKVGKRVHLGYSFLFTVSLKRKISAGLRRLLMKGMAFFG
jgi:hypothetical protein